MRLDEVTAEIRPRSDWEAVDLGFAMVRRDFWRCFSVWWLAVIGPTLIAGFLLWNHPIALMLLFWWWKPAGSRMVLYQISRRLFGEQPNWKSTFCEIPRAWRRRFFYRFVWTRFSPWMPVTLALEDLEGLRGNTYKIRSSQILRRGEGIVMWLSIVSEFATAWLTLAIMAMVKMLIPEGQDSAWRLAMETWNSDDPASIPLLILRTVCICMMLAISLTDLFVIGGGFGVYINTRTWIEGWDVELAFKRMAQRLGKIAVLMIVFFGLGLSGNGHATEPRSPAEVIKEVKANPDFKVHTVTERVPKKKTSSLRSSPALAGFAAVMTTLFAVCAVVLLLGGIGWVLWTYRHVFRMGHFIESDRVREPSARIVMGMEVTSDSLPSDVPAAAWMLWQQGRHQEALALLYRGSISQVIAMARVGIQESDTEGDCLRKVETAGSTAHPDYFRGITKAWICMAYAEICPAEIEVQALCQQWPFHGGRK